MPLHHDMKEKNALKPVGSALDPHRDAIRAKIAGGASISEIARTYKVDRSTLRHFIKTRLADRTVNVVAVPAAHTSTTIKMKALFSPTPAVVRPRRSRCCWSRTRPVSL